MSKRLEEIKTSTINICSCESCYCDGFTLQWVGVEPEHFEWLIDQAERMEELKKELHELGFQYDERMKDVDYLEEQNKRYREALTKISSVKNDEEFNPYAYMMLEIIEWARTALEESE